MIKLNTEKLAADLYKAFSLALKKAQDELYADAISAHHSLPNVDYTKTEIVQAAAYVLTCSVTGDAWAVMDEYGTGSLMDQSNPALDEYKSSGLWNPARTDTTIRTRPKGTYTNIFGEVQEGKAPRPGIDLEKVAPERILLVPPSHALEIAANWLRMGRFDEIIRSVVGSIPFSAYLEVKP